MAEERQNMGTQGNVGTKGGNVGGQGIDQIKRRLDNVNFPATKQELVNKVGTETVTVNGKNVNLKDAINRLQRDRFTSKDEVTRELQNLPEFKGAGNR